MKTPEEKYDKTDNVWAETTQGTPIHISKAISGRKGYFCLGCKKEMLAVKPKIQFRKEHFRHDHFAVKGEKKCTYSDETYRHKLAKELLQRLKHIQVPAVYKFPPPDLEGLKMLIKASEFIEAASIGVELTFYDDENGNLQWGSKKDIDKKYLLIKPDITFFDTEGEPLLFIELVATHGVNDQKMVKLKRLGVNTIQVRIPKDSEEAIEQSLYSTEFTKWIFNYEEERTEYVSISNGRAEAISPLDEEQRNLFTETFNCRQSEIKSLIRRVELHLGSKQYRTIEQGFRDELSRVKRNTKEHQSKLDGLRTEHTEAVNKKLAERRTKIEQQRERIEAEETELAKTNADLGQRYQNKDTNLTVELHEITRKQNAVNRELNGEGEDEDGVGNSNSGTKSSLENLIDFEKREIGRIEQDLETAPGEYKGVEDKLIASSRSSTELENREIERIENKISALPATYITEEEGLSSWLKSEEESITRLFKSQEGELPGEFKSKEDGLEREFEKLREQSLQAIMSRNGVGNTEIALRIRKLFEARGLLDDIEQIQKLYRRNRKAWECFKEGTYESWNK